MPNDYLDIMEVSGVSYDIHDSGARTDLAGKLDATAYTPTVIDSTLNSGSTNAIQNAAVATALGGVKIVKISDTDFEALTVKDPSTLYLVQETNP